MIRGRRGAMGIRRSADSGSAIILWQYLTWLSSFSRNTWQPALAFAPIPNIGNRSVMREQKITLREMRSSGGAARLIVYCGDYKHLSKKSWSARVLK